VESVTGEAQTRRDQTPYPLSVAPDRHHVLDASGSPFLLVGDAAWSILVALTPEEALRYLDDRASRGFNTIKVNLLEYYFAPDAPRNRAGEPPFSTPGDFSTMNPAYFDHARWVLERAAERGLLALLYPCYLGYRDAGWPGPKAWNEGWFGEVIQNGFDRCRAYGRFVGERFGDLDNLLWVMGGDADPSAARLNLDQMATGIREADPRHLMTAHCRPETVAADAYLGSTWLDINNTYTYAIVHAKVYQDYVRIPTTPTFLIESAYENEHTASEVQLRRQAYWSILRGGFGHVFGCTPIWYFGEGWEASLDSPGSRGMSRFAEAFRDRPWWLLEPEAAPGVGWDPRWQGRRLLVEGHGESRGLTFCSVARTPDGTLAMAYMPTPRTLTLDLTVLAGPVARLSWFDPIGGGWTDGGEQRCGENVTIEPPGDQDWLLELRASA
jgi:hypothetical protein